MFFPPGVFAVRFVLSPHAVLLLAGVPRRCVISLPDPSNGGPLTPTCTVPNSLAARKCVARNKLIVIGGKSLSGFAAHFAYRSSRHGKGAISVMA